MTLRRAVEMGIFATGDTGYFLGSSLITRKKDKKGIWRMDMEPSFKNHLLGLGE